MSKEKSKCNVTFEFRPEKISKAVKRFLIDKQKGTTYGLICPINGRGESKETEIAKDLMSSFPVIKTDVRNATWNFESPFGDHLETYTNVFIGESSILINNRNHYKTRQHLTRAIQAAAHIAKKNGSKNMHLVVPLIGGGFGQWDDNKNSTTRDAYRNMTEWIRGSLGHTFRELDSVKIIVPCPVPNLEDKLEELMAVRIGDGMGGEIKVFCSAMHTEGFAYCPKNIAQMLKQGTMPKLPVTLDDVELFGKEGNSIFSMTKARLFKASIEGQDGNRPYVSIKIKPVAVKGSE